MLLRLRLNQMALQPGQGLLAFRQRPPSVSAEWSIVPQPPTLISWDWTVPSAPASSTTTRHFIPLSWSPVTRPIRSTPQVMDGLTRNHRFWGGDSYKP